MRNHLRKFLLPSVAMLLFVPTAARAATLVNQPAPAFTRKDLANKPVSLSQYKGKVVLLNFWATWCGPCLLEIPKFVAWQQQYGTQGLQILGVSMDDEAAPVRKLSAKTHFTYPVMMGDAALGKQYGDVLGLPVTLLIDRNGVIRDRFEGEVDLAKVEQRVQALLKK